MLPMIFFIIAIVLLLVAIISYCIYNEFNNITAYSFALCVCFLVLSSYEIVFTGIREIVK